MEEKYNFTEEKLSNYILDIAAAPFGSNLKVESFVPQGFPIIDGANLKCFKVTDNVTKFVTDEKARSLHRSIAKRNDVIVTISGNVGQISYIPMDSKYSEYLVSQRQFRVTFDTTKVYVPYLVYYFHTKEGQHKILSFANQTGVPALAQPLKNFKNIDIFLPDILSQKRIAKFLSSLDDKIEMNRRINDNLEQQAQALFKSWFVDFEPFRDGKFVDSELGMIPKGWRVGTIAELTSNMISGDWGKESLTTNYSHKVFCIRGADIPDLKVGNRGKMPIRFILEKNFMNKRLNPDDLVIEISGGSPTQSTGRACRISSELISYYNKAIICTNFCKAISPIKGYSAYIYYLWDSLYKQGIMFLYENGTTGIKNLDINGLLEKLKVIIPPEEIAFKFSDAISKLSNKTLANSIESAKLAQIRDSLLPRLMSGELKINDLNC